MRTIRLLAVRCVATPGSSAGVLGWTSPVWRASLVIVGAAAIVFGCDGSDLTVPDQGLAAKIVIVRGDPQTAAAGTQLPDSLIVRVTDSKDRPIVGQQVRFTPSAGTVVPATATTNADGRTGAIWVLGSAAGPQTVTATATGKGAPPGLAVTFHATATSSAPAKLDKAAGDGQQVTAGSPVPTPPAVKVTDAGGNPVAGVAVTFAVTAGGGSVNPTTPVSTNATGVAAATSWTLGAVAGPNTLTATIPGTGITGNPVTFTATGTPTPTVAVGLGPFVGESGCSGNYLSSFYGSTAYDVNSDGVVVGETNCVAGEQLTFRWSQATGMQQLANYPGGYPIFGGRINKAGNIAALFRDDFHPIIWTPTNTRIDLAATMCGPYSCGGAAPGDINDNNEVVGSPTASLTGPWRWTPTAGLVYLPALGSRDPVAINRQGDIAAVSPGPYPAVGGTAILSQAGTLTLISGFLAEDMNANREVVGATGTWPTTTAARWSDSKGIRNLGTLGGSTSYAYGINNSGEVVGSSTTSSGEVHAFYWNVSRGMVDLGPGSAYAISDAGDMVGIAPSGLFPPDIAPAELWQATLWRGTGGVAASSVTARATAAPTGRAATCFNDAGNWQSKTKMFRCLSKHP